MARVRTARAFLGRRGARTSWRQAMPASTIDVAVTAINTAGTGQATSAATAVVTTPVQPPVNTSQPTISGQTVVGDTLTAAMVRGRMVRPASLSVAGLRFVGCELLEHFWRDQQLV